MTDNQPPRERKDVATDPGKIKLVGTSVTLLRASQAVLEKRREQRNSESQSK